MDAVEAIEPEELRDGAVRLLADKVDRRAAWGEDETSQTAEDLYAEMTNLGWFMLTIPPQNGGLGQSFAALAPIYEEMGRALSPLQIAQTMAAIDVLVADGGEAASALLDRIAEGAARVVVLEGDGDLEAQTVPEAGAATTALVLPSELGAPVRIVEFSQDAVTIQDAPTWDRGRRYGDVKLTGAASVSLSLAAGEASAIAQAHEDLAMAWDSVGAARQALDESVEYMGTRKQFNRPIGSFQALKHRAADLKVKLEIARALTGRAADAFAQRSDGWSTLAGQARLLAIDAFRAISEESIQFHGGIGFTWEHDAHIFLKRAVMNELLGGGVDRITDRVASSILTRALAGR
jgi:alkylation response protein AidB-like acyl-CoA dehydrogenase